MLSDHYDPRSKTLRLSQEVYNTPSVAAAGVAAHEAGHALQDAVDYLPMELRSYIVPGVQLRVLPLRPSYSLLVYCWVFLNWPGQV